MWPLAAFASWQTQYRMASRIDDLIIMKVVKDRMQWHFVGPMFGSGYLPAGDGWRGDDVGVTRAEREWGASHRSSSMTVSWGYSFSARNVLLGDSVVNWKW